MRILWLVLTITFTLDLSIPPNQWPMLFAHDFATGYLLSGGIVKKEEMDWAQTQPGSITKLLNCGARAFDWRGYFDGNDLIFHHGAVKVHQKMEDTLMEVKTWLSNHTTELDFVLISSWDCENADGFSNCSSLASDLYDKHGFYQFSQSDLTGMTMEKLLQRSKLDSGGFAAVMIEPPLSPYYNENLACAGYTFDKRNSKSQYTKAELLSLTYKCYSDSSSKQRPLDEMWAYVKNVTELPPAPDQLYSLQALWQETTDSVEIGVVEGGSLLKTEVWSNLNKLVLDRLDNFTYVNLLEVNNLCDQGPNLLEKLRKRIH